MKKRSSFLTIFPPALLAALLVFATASDLFADNQAQTRRLLMQQLKDTLRSSVPVKQATVKPVSSTWEPGAIGRNADGFLRYIGAPPGHHFPVQRAVAGRPAQTALHFLRDNAELLAPKNTRVDFVLKKSKQYLKHHFEKFDQTYAGIPVFGAKTIVQLNDFAGVEAVIADIAKNFDLFDGGTVSIIPTLSADDAIAAARVLYAIEAPGVEVEVTLPVLMIFDPAVIGDPGNLHLIWYFKANDGIGGQISEQVLVDAHNGEIVERFTLIFSAKLRKIWDADNTASSIIVRTEGDPTAVGYDEANRAYDYFGDTYDYYDFYFQRNGIDNNDMYIYATVRYCLPGEECPWTNAHFNPNTNWFSFGDGYAADDIVAHEFTHGVTYYESGLVYQNHSGAINESLSDVFGEFVDLKNVSGTDTPVDVRWLFGEDDLHRTEDGRWWNTWNGEDGDGIPEIEKDCENLTDDDGDGLINEGCIEKDAQCDNGIDDNLNGFIDEGCPESGAACGNGVDDDGDTYIDEGCPGSCQDGIDNGGNGGDYNDTECYSRNMKDPPKKSDPDRMGSEHFVPIGTADDHGGVHTNSGVNNKLCYLLTDGDSFNGETVVGLGIDKVAALYYHANAYLLSMGSDYYDLYYVLRQAAINMGWTAAERNNLYRACNAVEIAATRTIYVDLYTTVHQALQDGSSERPYTFLSTGYAEVFPGDTMIIRDSSYSGTYTFDKQMTIERAPGVKPDVTIGRID